MGWNIIFRICEITGVLRLLYFLTVERGQMKRTHRNLWEERGSLRFRGR